MKTSSDFSTAAAIKALRIERNLSQLELSHRSGMSPAQLCKIERGRNGLTTSTLRRLADALDVPVSALMGESVSSAPVQNVGRNGERVADKSAAEELVPVFAAGVAERSIAEEVARHERLLLEAESGLGIVQQSTLRLVYAYGGD